MRGQRVQQIRRPDKAGLELRAAAADHLRQLVCRLLRVLGKRKIDGERAFRLRLIDRICLTERTDDALVQRFVCGDVLTEHAAGLYDERSGMRVERGSDQIFAARTLIAA